jgi:hypothetical protein
MSIGDLEERVPQLAWTKYFTTIMMDRYSLHTQVTRSRTRDTYYGAARLPAHLASRQGQME